MRQNVLETNETDFMAYVVFLIYMDEQGDRHTPVTDLWSNTSGKFIYIATISTNRFQQITKIIRFDDKNTCIERRETDKFAQIREVFTKVNEALPLYVTAGMHTVVDEML